jgi:hypothetical protein
MGGHFFSKGGVVVGKNNFLRSIGGSINSFFVRFFAGKNRKIFLEEENDRSQRPPRKSAPEL